MSTSCSVPSSRVNVSGVTSAESKGSSHAPSNASAFARRSCAWSGSWLSISGIISWVFSLIQALTSATVESSKGAEKTCAPSLPPHASRKASSTDRPSESRIQTELASESGPSYELESCR